MKDGRHIYLKVLP
jgi:hypothetical protein